MVKIPEKIKQIAIVHAQLINSVVSSCQNKELVLLLEPELKKAENNGWLELIKTIRKIIAGQRDTQLLIGLDEEDAAIILSILVGIQNPHELPKLNQVNKSEYAPQAIAKLIITSRQQNQEAKNLLDTILVQMKSSDSEMIQIANMIEKLSKNELDINTKYKNLTEQSRKFIDKILENLPSQHE